MLPPLMFSEEEIEALVLGSRWVPQRGDGPLGLAARTVLAKVGAVLPADLKAGIEASGLLIGPGEAGAVTNRTIWPFVLAFYDRVRVVAAWCEMRQGYRHFRTDRISVLEATPARYPRRPAEGVAPAARHPGAMRPGSMPPDRN